MHVDITGHHVELTDALKNYVRGKLAKLEQRFVQIVKAHVVLTVDAGKHKAEVTMYADGHEFVAVDESADMYAAIDQMADKLERQVVKHKGKHHHHHRGS